MVSVRNKKNYRYPSIITDYSLITLTDDTFFQIKGQFLVRWRSNGEAEFHVDCWDVLLKLSRYPVNSVIKEGFSQPRNTRIFVYMYLCPSVFIFGYKTRAFFSL